MILIEKTAIMTDTAADLSWDFVEEHDIKVLPFRIIYPDGEYRDGIDITSEKIYRDIEDVVVKSSIPSMEDIEQAFKDLSGQGYTHVIVITLSSGLSGIHNSVRVASDKFEELNVHIEDSKSISMGEGLLVMRAAQMKKNGSSFDSIVREIGLLKEKISLYFVVETLKYLIRGGRIGRVSGAMAETLNVKPVIASSLSDGKYYTVAKVRGRKKSIEKLLDIVKQKAAEKSCKAYILHGNAREEMREFADRVKNINGVSEVITGGNITPVAGVHSGPGLIGIVLVEE